VKIAPVGQDKPLMPYNDPQNQTPDETDHLLTQLTRIGIGIDKELTLIGERMSWLNISESFIFSAFTVAVANHEKTMVLEIVACLMPLVGFLLALFVYPALLAAHLTAKRLKAERHQFELKLPEDLQVKLLAPKREHFLGSVPAFVIPGMLLLVWSVIIVALVFVPWRR
jgi:hypothetical protein